MTDGEPHYGKVAMQIDEAVLTDSFVEYNYESLLALARSRGRRLPDIIAQAVDNDPFFAGHPGRRFERAHWFAELWTRLDIPDGIHVRRLHYLFCSTGVILPSGANYSNTLKDWKFLVAATSDARYLKLVPAEAFVDRRAAELIVYFPREGEHTPPDRRQRGGRPPPGVLMIL